MQQSFNINRVDPTQFEYQIYSTQDTDLITTTELVEQFDTLSDYVEYYIYDGNQSLVYRSDEGTFKNYRIFDNKLYIDPQEDIKQLGFTDGLYYTVYNFFTNLAGSSPTSKYFIAEISSDRTEIRLDTTTIPETVLQQQVDAISRKITNTSYYYDFYLNFGNNQQIIANNIALDLTDPTNSTILIKLYEPLPDQYQVNTQLWIVENLREPIAYSINITTQFEEVRDFQPMKGPNFTVDTANQASPIIPTNYSTLLSSTAATGTGSLTYQLQSLLQEKGITLNIDYSEYTNFIHFSSARTRLENFYYKLAQLEQYQATASLGLNNLNTYSSASQAAALAQIQSIISNFDGYEYYLYYESGSTNWPKSNSIPPFANYSTTSQTAIDWLDQQLVIASRYDEDNVNNLIYSIPPYLRDDLNNSQLQLFVEMLGQHFDTLWTYIKDISNKYDADNRLDYGISKDLVTDVLTQFGVNVYENNFSAQNLYSAFLGITPSGSLLNIPNTTTTLPASTGLEYITSFVTASSTSSLVPLDDANKEIYKRIYHNLPYLFKKKGTTAGLRALINLYGIPDTILRINEFGGKDKVDTSDWDNWQDQFNYALNSTDVAVTSSLSLEPNGIPSSIQFRFKTPSLSTIDYETSPKFVLLNILQSNPISSLVLEYSGSGLTSASYSGSTLDPYYQHATLKWIPDLNNSNYSASIYLPFFNENWWSIMLNFSSGSASIFDYPTTSSLYVKQKGVFEGDNYILYEQSSSVTQSTNPGNYRFLSLSPDQVTISSTTYSRLTNSKYQELRYYNTQISQSIFDDFVVNPLSIGGNTISGSQSAYDSLRFRAPLGTDLNIVTATVAKSIHPSVTGSITGIATSSFNNGTSNYYFYPHIPDFTQNREYVYQDQPNAGIKIPISDKIKLGSQILPTGDALSPYISIQQDLPISSSYTKDVNYVEVGFSPQDEINDDIQDQLGFFNFGEYIGDPRQVSSSNTSYLDLNKLRDFYFQKYTKNYNTTDYIRLIKYLDNSLFKMIKDFAPARTGLATGVIIKQHILERNRYRTPQAQWENDIYTGSVSTLSTGYDTGSPIYTFDGGTGGSLPTLTTITGSGLESNISQSWNEVVLTPLGTGSITHDNLEEFYNGQFEGTTITVSDGVLISEDCQEFLDVSTTEVQYKPILYLYNGNAPMSESIFLSSDVTPSNGEILLYFISEQVEQGSPNSNTNSQQRPNQNTQ